MSHYSFLNELDEKDEDFLALARLLLGGQVEKKKLNRIKQIKKPLEYLFKGRQISKEASEISTEEIRLYSKKKRKQRRLK